MTDAPAGVRHLRYELRPDSTTVTFSTRHLLGLGAVRGTVALLNGSAVVHAEDGALLEVHAVLDMTTFDSGSARRDAAVASRRLLDTATHPRATYRSTSVKPRAEGGWRVHGHLTARGVAAPVDIVIDSIEPAGQVQITARASVDRRAHDIGIPRALAGRLLQISIDGQARQVHTPEPHAPAALR